MPDSTCIQLENAVQNAADRRMTIEAAIAASIDRAPGLAGHVEDCGRCRAFLDGQLVLECATAEWAVDVPDVDLTDSIIDRLQKPETVANSGVDAAPDGNRTTIAAVSPDAGAAPVVKSPPHGRRRTILSIVAAAAACLAVVLVYLYSTSPINVADNQPPNATERLEPVGTTIGPDEGTPANADPDPARPTDPMKDGGQETEVASLFNDARSAWRSLADEAAGAVTDGAVLIPPGDGLAMNVVPDPQREQSPSDRDNAWTRGLKPLEKNLNRAVDFLFNALPPEPPAI